VTQQPHLPAKLLAIIEVSPSEKVRCGRPGWGNLGFYAKTEFD